MVTTEVQQVTTWSKAQQSEWDIQEEVWKAAKEWDIQEEVWLTTTMLQECCKKIHDRLSDPTVNKPTHPSAKMPRMMKFGKLWLIKKFHCNFLRY